jgi:2'-5' RNA ligase
MADDARRPKLQVPRELRAGVWANWSEVETGPDEFTLHFARLGAFPDGPDSGMLVARVNLSSRGFRRLLDQADTLWDEYARKSMPPEID